MTAPTPADFDAACDEVVSFLREAQTEYRWAHGVAHSRTVGDEVKVTASRSDPVGSILLSKRSTRKACERAMRDIKDARDAVDAAIKGLNSALHLVDPKPRFEPLRYKADATRADITEAREAQMRRREQGEAVPD